MHPPREYLKRALASLAGAQRRLLMECQPASVTPQALEAYCRTSQALEAVMDAITALEREKVKEVEA